MLRFIRKLKPTTNPMEVMCLIMVGYLLVAGAAYATTTDMVSQAIDNANKVERLSIIGVLALTSICLTVALFYVVRFVILRQQGTLEKTNVLMAKTMVTLESIPPALKEIRDHCNTVHNK